MSQRTFTPMKRLSILIIFGMLPGAFGANNNAAAASAFLPPAAAAVGRSRGSTPSASAAKIKPPRLPRGGGRAAPPSSAAAAAATMADHSAAARALFGNVVSPAALLAGGLVPLGFLAAPLPGETSPRKKLRCAYSLLSVFSISNELLAVMYATVASNKLAEVAVVTPTASAFELIRRDYELPWIGANVHLILGLCGFVSMVMLRAFTIFPRRLNIASAGMAGSALLTMISVVNRGVSRGDDRGNVFGKSMLSLVVRYGVLLVKTTASESGGVVAWAGLVLGVASVVLAVHELLSPESQ